MTNDDARRDGAILAGLRLLQAMQDGSLPVDDQQRSSIEDVASNGGEVEILDADEIDELCEAFNLGEINVS